MRTIISDSAGNLVLRLKVLGQRFSEQTQFNDSPQNRAYLRNTLKKIDEEIKCRCARAKRAGGGRLR
ncbi:Arm DNA-binding domain-containing protein [Arsukibacterium sp.]|uniref:Arm DNA-binding domain-containing protein n=1 Tax=Arsukibacterium sp. TaxID=1977258 RepID=UPI0039A6C359